MTEITRGLAAGEMVVVSGQFLFDSEASLKGAGSPATSGSAGAGIGGSNAVAPGALAEHRGDARVERISGDAVTLSHGPIGSIKWGAMTMDFKPPAQGLPRNVQVGDRVDFEFYIDVEGLPQITRVQPLAPEPKAAAASGGKP